jgi:hypothetical protein
VYLLSSPANPIIPSGYTLLHPIPLVLHVLHVLFAHVVRWLLPERDADSLQLVGAVLFGLNHYAVAHL